MKKVMQIMFALTLSLCIDCYAGEMQKWYTIIGEVEILEKSIQATIEVESWSRIRTWDLKYPYFDGDEEVLLGEVNNQVYEWVRDEYMDDSEYLYYTELTYEVTYKDERFVSILFEGEGGGNSYYGRGHGMSFDFSLKQERFDFFIKDGYLYFVTEAYPSFREDSYVRWEVPLHLSIKDWETGNAKDR